MSWRTRENYRNLGYCNLKSTDEPRGMRGPSFEPAQDDVADPFTHRLDFTTWDIVKIVINTLWLLPLRLIFLIFPSFFTGSLLCTVTIPWCNIREDQPLQGWRKFIMQRICPLVDRWFLFGCGFQWIKTVGQPFSTTKAPIVIVSPHSSVFDMFILAVYGLPSFVSRAESKHVPVYGRILTHALQTIFVSRLDSDSRQQCSKEIERRANSGGLWPPVLIFPEGTTTNRKRILLFKNGAFYPKLPVQPVIIKYKNRLNTMVWGDNGINWFASIYFTLCQFHNFLEVEFLPVHYPSEEEKQDATLFAQNMQEIISRASGIPTSQCTFGDVILARHARKIGLPYSAGLVEYNKNIKQFGLSMDHMKGMLERFAAMDRDKDGYVTESDMAMFLGAPEDVHMSTVFSSLKPQSASRLTFCHYLCNGTKLSRPLLEDNQYMHQTFQMFDRDADGLLKEEDLYQLQLQARLPPTTTPQEIKRTSWFGRQWRPRHTSDEEADLESNPRHWNFDQFKTMLESCPEFLLLLHECHSERIRCTDPEIGHTFQSEVV